MPARQRQCVSSALVYGVRVLGMARRSVHWAFIAAVLVAIVARGPLESAWAEDPPAAGSDGSDSPTEEVTDVQIRYALAKLKLAELDLQRAVKLNRPVSNSIGALEITRLTNHVRLMQRQVEIAQGKPQSSAREVALVAAELARETAQADLDAALAANKRTEGAIKEINIKRLEAKLEIAEIRLELFRNPTYVPSPIDEMQWHIDQLTEQLIDLRHRLDTRSSNDFGNME
jgi:hypothetical protein